jgi:hypothetical protein
MCLAVVCNLSTSTSFTDWLARTRLDMLFRSILGRGALPRLCRAAQFSASTAGSGFQALFPPGAFTPEYERTLQDKGIHVPTPIQEAAIPMIYGGGNGLIHAETGSGKTLTFMLPLLMRAVGTDDQVLFLSPTRELAVQLANEARSLLPPSERERVQLVVQGAETTFDLIGNAKVLVATPSKLLEYLNSQGNAHTGFPERLSAVCLDEVDFQLPYFPKNYKRKARSPVQPRRRERNDTERALSIIFDQVRHSTHAAVHHLQPGRSLALSLPGKH